MSNAVDSFLDPFMLAIHGETYLNSPVIRLATFIYCASLPNKLVNDVVKNKNGNSVVVVNLYPGIPGYSSNIVNPDNVLEQLLSNTNGKLIHRVNLPFQYVKQNHVKGAALMSWRVKHHLGCEMQVTTVTGSDLKFELIHNSSKRLISFTISD